MTEETRSPYALAKLLEADIIRLLSSLDVATLSPKEHGIFVEIKNTMIDARLDIQDYELAETRDFQLENARDAQGRLAIVQGHISTNTLHVFGAVDVAHLTARIGQIVDLLR